MYGAIADFDPAIELDPKYAIAYTNRGFAKRPGAIWTEPLPTTTGPLNRSGTRHRLQQPRQCKEKAKGDLDGAIADYNRAIELNPKYASAYYNRGNAKEAKGDLDGAIADFKRATEVDRKTSPSLKSRRRCQIGTGSHHQMSPTMTPCAGF